MTLQKQETEQDDDVLEMKEGGDEWGEVDTW